MTDLHIWALIAVIALVTALLRFLPFAIFRDGKKTPKIIEKLSKSLPSAIMAMLVIYCLKDVNFASASGFLPPLIAGAAVCLLHLWKRNTLLSTIGGTLCYMLLVQTVF